MRFTADLHIHSHYSRATSSYMTPEALWRWAQIKGISVMGTGDFTHPAWLEELERKLEPAQGGLFKLKKPLESADVPASCRQDVLFIPSAEVSCIYNKARRVRKIHMIILAPDLQAAARINARLSKIGNLSADGRPILGVDAKELVKIVLDASPKSMLIPAHAWTPHFSLFGSASGFDSLEECFEELSSHIHAIETGLSSDPRMNWRLSVLDRLTLVSNSDAHSPSKLGREANILDTDLSYAAICKAIETRDGFEGTIEFFPEEGKYHYDGHRTCRTVFSPKETIKRDFACPVCGKRLTIGVMHRVESLADREDGARPEDAPGYRSVIPLAEIIAEALDVGVNTKKVEMIYFSMIERLGSEFRILMETPLDEIETASGPLIAEGIDRMRKGRVNISPGYDGEYGKVKIFDDADGRQRGQIKLF